MLKTTDKLPRRVERYLLLQEMSCKASTIGTYRVALKPFCKFLASALSVETITKQEMAGLSREILQKYLIALCDKPLAAYSRVNYLLAIRKYLDWEAAEGTIAPDILPGFNRDSIPKVPEYLPKPLSLENDRLIMQRFKDAPIYCSPMFQLLRLTGLRISELINLPKNCIVSLSDNEPFLKVPLGKMNNERMVPLHHEAVDIIGLIKGNTQKTNPRSKRLIGIDGGVPKIYRLLRTQFNKFTADIIDQGKPVTFHRLRHTYATSLLSAGVSILSIMKLLGHKRIEMTLRYAKVVPSHLREEYLKAIDVLKKSWLPCDLETPTGNSLNMNPLELLDLLKASILKMNAIKPRPLRNLLRRIARIKSLLPPEKGRGPIGALRPRGAPQALNPAINP